MKVRRFLWLLALVALAGSLSILAQVAEQYPAIITTNSLGLITIGPAVFSGVKIDHPLPSGIIGTNSAGVPIRRPVSRLGLHQTNLVFDHFLPESLSYGVFTNLFARTNDRSTRIWLERSHPPGWSNEPPIVKWDTNCLIWGMIGLTALSPCWSDEGSSGQAPVTALTRRHGYARGHSMGAEGFHQNRKGRTVWFLTAHDQIVEVKVLREVVRCSRVGDYTILLFDRDLPPTIEPLRVVSETNLFAKYPYGQPTPWCLLRTEQSGNVSANLPGFFVNTLKPGDSGSPDLLPVGNELIFVHGRTTTGASPQMQADMDELCRQEKLDPGKYQMEWADLAEYPSYQLHL